MKIFTMTKTVTKNLVTGPATLMYPQRERIFTAITRGRIENAIDRCIFCGMCGRRCPTYAIVVTKESKAWQIDRLKCCTCNLCVEVCPVKCLSTDNHGKKEIDREQDPRLGEWLEKFDRDRVEAAREFWYETLKGIDESLLEFF